MMINSVSFMAAKAPRIKYVKPQIKENVNVVPRNQMCAASQNTNPDGTGHDSGGTIGNDGGTGDNWAKQISVWE